MKVDNIIKILEQFPKDLEVRIVNSSIDDDNECPSFEIEEIFQSKEMLFGFKENKETDFIAIGIQDDTYIDRDFILNN